MPDTKILEKKIGAEVNQTPVVSVIIPAYNTAKFIVETLASIFAQTYKNYEVVLVDDGSPDSEELEKMLAPYFDKITYIKQKNAGTAAARNTAIENSGGEFLAFLDGDDVWFPEYLESQIEALKTKNCDLIYADVDLFDGVSGREIISMRRSPSSGAVSAESLIKGTCSIVTSGVMARREIVAEAKMFDEELPRIGIEDFDLWFRLAKSGKKIDYQQKVLLKYRIRPDSLSGSIIQRLEREIAAFEIIGKKYELNAAERTLLSERKKESAALIEIEKGKRSIAAKDFPAAQKHFRAANIYYRKFKLTVLTKMLQFNPQTVHTLFRAMRPAEFSFVSPNKKVKADD